jgi:hypothetical protein
MVRAATDDPENMFRSVTEEASSSSSGRQAPKLTFSQPDDVADSATNGMTRPRGKSLKEKYHPVDASGKLLHAKIVNATVTNPHHTHLDLHHPSPVRTPSPTHINTNPKCIESKLGKTEKMNIDKYEDGKRHILVGATGSVASVKIPLIVRSLLAHEEVEVQVIVTKTAKHFFDVDKLKTELGVKVWEDDDDWRVHILFITLIYKHIFSRLTLNNIDLA